MAYNILPSAEVVAKVVAGLASRGISAVVVQTKEEALAEVKRSLPEGVDLMTGSSTTLEQIGFIDLLKSGQHPWKNFKDVIFAEKDPQKQAELRRQSILAHYFLGSVHAITEDGISVTASGSGSQIPSYAFSSENVIWVVGTHKIVPTLDEALKRVTEYSFPLEDARMKAAGYPGSTIGMMLIYERLIMPRKLKMILVNEVLGF